MARQRLIIPLREIIASDVNSVSEYLLYDMQTILKDCLALSEGVISGLEVTSPSGLIVTIPSGIASNGDGKFYELLESTNLTLPSGSATHKIYVTFDSEEDLLIAAFQLFSTAIRDETYTTANVRLYDSLTPARTTGTIPSGSILIAEATVTGSTITSLTDERTFVTFGNILSFDLQNLVDLDKNDYTISGKISGVIMDDSDIANYKGFSATVNNSHAGTGFYANTGTNAGAKGFATEVNGANIGFYANLNASSSTGFKIDLNAGSTGINIVGVNSTDFGIKIATTKTPIEITNSATGNGITIVGANNDDYGVQITNAEFGIKYSNTTMQASSYGIKIESGNTSSTANYGQIISVNRHGIGLAIEHTTANSGDDFVGFKLDNKSGQSQVDSFAISIGGDSTDNFATGLSFQRCLNSISITDIAEANSIVINKTNGTIATSNSAIKTNIKRNSIALYIEANDSVSTDLIGIYALKTSSANFEAILVGQDYTTGIGLLNLASSTAIDITGNGTSDFGLKIAGAATGIQVSTRYKSLEINVLGNVADGIATNTAIDINVGIQGYAQTITFDNTVVGTNGDSYGLIISNTTSNNVVTGISIAGGGSSQKFEKAINIFDATLGIIIDHTAAGSSTGVTINNTSLPINITNVHSSGRHMRLQPLSADPATDLVNGDLAVVDTGTGAKLKIYNSSTATWEVCN